MSPLSWCCHCSAMVPKGIALPPPARARWLWGLWVEGGCGEGLHHPSSALQDGVLGLLLPVASKRGSDSIWI